MLTNAFPHNSAKELEHYQRVRATFEGPAKPKAITARASSPMSIRGSTTTDSTLDPHHPLAYASRKKPKPARSNTARKDDLKGKGKGKGKEKASEWADNDDDDEDDDAYVTSNDTMGTPEPRYNGGFFGNGTRSDDEEDMYR